MLDVEEALTFLAAQRSTVHGLAHRPQHQAYCVLDLDVVLILLLQ